MPKAPFSIAGKYVGRSKVREGREAELSPQERKQLEKASNVVDLELRADGTFSRQVTEGTWKETGDRLHFSPTRFGGKTKEEMERAAEEMGRAFGLGFVFNEFELIVKGEALWTADERSLIYIEFTRE
jgi:hypothetical protein